MYLHSFLTTTLIEINGQFRARDNSRLEERLRYVLEERMCGLQKWSGCLGKRTSEITGNERRSLCPIDRSLVQLKENFLIVLL